MESRSGFTKEMTGSAVADKTLRVAVQFWFVVAVIGQWIFASYIIAYYGGSAARGNMDMWNQVFPRGYVANDLPGNLLVILHLFLAAVVTVGGPLQLIPQIRARLPIFHRWNGRVYLLAVCIVSIAGLGMFFSRGSVGGPMQLWALAINAMLVIGAAAMALRYALAGKFNIHRRWALRVFLLASGVWFFRIALMLWLVLNQGPAGFDPETFQGPFLSFLAFAQYLFPLAVLEVYFRVQDAAHRLGQFMLAAAIIVLTLAMAAGIAAATLLMWLPRL
ncbi:MAG TPA: DUF2306 domain-containing protein [Cellvibrio sp.]|nr:DUF2306 domain-containing protein [Cellvibrio sp.]